MKLACIRTLFFLLLALPAESQFKEIGPPPFSQSVARQKIRQLLASVNSGNRKQIVGTLSGWVAWYRDILDEELVEAWHRDSRANLPEVIEALSDERVAVGVVEFSWRQSRRATVNLTYAPLLSSLMARYPKSSEAFLRDLLGPAPELSAEEAEGVCRILIDMPEVGSWRENAMQILPHYSEAAKGLLTQDLHASDEDKRYRAELWMTELKLTTPAAAPAPQSRRRGLVPYTAPEPVTEMPRRLHVDGPPVPMETEPKAARVTLPVVSSPGAPSTSAASPSAPSPPTPAAEVPPAKPGYEGPKSGTYESTGGPIPQSAEYVFRNLPPLKMRLDYDTKVWEARLVPGEGKTQRLIVRNKSNSPQKRCIVRWTAVE